VAESNKKANGGNGYFTRRVNGLSHLLFENERNVMKLVQNISDLVAVFPCRLSDSAGVSAYLIFNNTINVSISKAESIVDEIKQLLDLPEVDELGRDVYDLNESVNDNVNLSLTEYLQNDTNLDTSTNKKIYVVVHGAGGSASACIMKDDYSKNTSEDSIRARVYGIRHNHHRQVETVNQGIQVLSTFYKGVTSMDDVEDIRKDTPLSATNEDFSRANQNAVQLFTRAKKKKSSNTGLVTTFHKADNDHIHIHRFTCSEDRIKYINDRPHLRLIYEAVMRYINTNVANLDSPLITDKKIRMGWTDDILAGFGVDSTNSTFNSEEYAASNLNNNPQSIDSDDETTYEYDGEELNNGNISPIVNVDMDMNPSTSGVKRQAESPSRNPYVQDNSGSSIPSNLNIGNINLPESLAAELQDNGDLTSNNEQSPPCERPRPINIDVVALAFHVPPFETQARFKSWLGGRGINLSSISQSATGHIASSGDDPNLPNCIVVQFHTPQDIQDAAYTLYNKKYRNKKIEMMYINASDIESLRTFAENETILQYADNQIVNCAMDICHLSRTDDLYKFLANFNGNMMKISAMLPTLGEPAETARSNLY